MLDLKIAKGLFARNFAINPPPFRSDPRGEIRHRSHHLDEIPGEPCEMRHSLEHKDPKRRPLRAWKQRGKSQDPHFLDCGTIRFHSLAATVWPGQFWHSVADP